MNHTPEYYNRNADQFVRGTLSVDFTEMPLQSTRQI